MPEFVEVALKLPLRTEFTYRVPAGMRARVGNRVKVPFRGRTRPGVITAVTEECAFDTAKVLDVESVLDASLVLPDAVMALCRSIARDYGCSLGEALDAALPAAAKARGVRKIPHLELAIQQHLAEEAVLELEDKHQARSRVLRTVMEYGAPMPVIFSGVPV